MSQNTNTLKLLNVLKGSYRPSGEELVRLAKLARLNKLYLAYLRRVGDVLKGELLREEAKYRWFMGNAVEVVGVLERVNAVYALYKFRRPFEHVSVDLDLLVGVEGVSRAVRALVERGFRISVLEPYTVTLERRGFIVDLYTHPSFAWAVYMDGGRLLSCCVEEVEVRGVSAKALSREAEVVVVAAHAVYKEHLVLLMDCLLAWRWLNSKVWEVSTEFKVEIALEELLKICDLIRRGLAETPYRLRPHVLARAYLGKTLEDPAFRTTLPNVLRYLKSRGHVGARVLDRLRRESY